MKQELLAVTKCSANSNSCHYGRTRFISTKLILSTIIRSKDFIPWELLPEVQRVHISNDNLNN